MSKCKFKKKSLVRVQAFKYIHEIEEKLAVRGRRAGELLQAASYISGTRSHNKDASLILETEANGLAARNITTRINFPKKGNGSECLPFEFVVKEYDDAAASSTAERPEIKIEFWLCAKQLTQGNLNEVVAAVINEARKTDKIHRKFDAEDMVIIDRLLDAVLKAAKDDALMPAFLMEKTRDKVTGDMQVYLDEGGKPVTYTAKYHVAFDRILYTQLDPGMRQPDSVVLFPLKGMDKGILGRTARHTEVEIEPDGEGITDAGGACVTKKKLVREISHELCRMGTERFQDAANVTGVTLTPSTMCKARIGFAKLKLYQAAA